MEKYGYKNITSRNEFEKSSENEGHHDFSYNSGKHITHQGFINWGEQKDWGVPGQTVYTVNTVDDLLKANEIVSNTNH